MHPAHGLQNSRIVVRIDAWPVSSLLPEVREHTLLCTTNAAQGHFVREIGPLGDVHTDTQALLVEHDIDIAPFSPKQVDGCDGLKLFSRCS